MSNSTHWDKTPNNEEEITEINREVNKKQVISVMKVSLNRDGENKSKDNDVNI